MRAAPCTARSSARQALPSSGQQSQGSDVYATGIWPRVKTPLHARGPTKSTWRNHSQHRHRATGPLFAPSGDRGASRSHGRPSVRGLEPVAEALGGTSPHGSTGSGGFCGKPARASTLVLTPFQVPGSKLERKEGALASDSEAWLRDHSSALLCKEGAPHQAGHLVPTSASQQAQPW